MRSFYLYDIFFLVIFTFFLILFLVKNRKRLKREGLLYLYRTKVGIKFINYIGKNYKKTLSVFSVLAIISGYLLMCGMIYLLWKIVYIYFFLPEVVKVIKIPPLMPLIPYIPSIFKVNFLPPFYFTYWIIAIAIIAVFHEFAHGIIARRYGIKIKTTGFGFLGPFLAAFVEPDEKQMSKKPKFQQIAVLTAGSFTNLLLAVFFFFLLSGFFVLAYTPAGALFNTYVTSAVKVSSLEYIDGLYVKNLSSKEILHLLKDTNLTDNFIVGNQDRNFSLTKIIADNKTYFITLSFLKEQLEQSPEYVILYTDLPAIRAGMRGVIVKVDDQEIKTNDDLKEVLKKYKPGDKIRITTLENGNISVYEFELGENPEEKGKPMIGIGYISSSGERLTQKLWELTGFFKKPATFYKPKFNHDLIVFIYNLLWWLALINFSVALINMWPLAIFDGGRVFLLTVWALTKNEKFANFLFKLFSYIIIGSLFLVMLRWIEIIFLRFLGL